MNINLRKETNGQGNKNCKALREAWGKLGE